VEGAYRPDLYDVEYDEDGHLAARTSQSGAPPIVTRRYVANLDAFPTATSVIAPGSVFGDYFLVEASRGCEWGCRFCAAGFMYRPIRSRSVEQLKETVAAGLEARPTIGLVGAEMASVPGVAELCEFVSVRGWTP